MKKIKHKHRKKEKQNKTKQNHVWAAEKQLLPKGPEKTPKGEGSNRHLLIQ